MLKIDEELNELTIRIGGMSARNIPVAIFLAIWLTGWAFGEFFALTSLFSSQSPWAVKGFLLIWLTGWTVAGGLVLLHMIKLSSGSETIEIGRGLFKISRRILFIKRTRSYDIFRIREMKAMGGHKSKFQLFNSGRIQFIYDEKPVRFGSDLGKGEEEQVISSLIDHKDFSDKNFQGFL